MSSSLLWLIWGCSVFLKGYFAISETALFAADRLELTRRAQSGDHGATRCLRFLEDPKKLLSGLLLGTNLAMVLATVTAGSLGQLYLPFGARNEAITTALMIILVLFATELIPKGYAVQAPERIACALSGPLSLMLLILYPLSRPFDRLAARVVTAMGRPAYQERQGDDEIITLAEMSSEAGQITSDAEEMIAAVLTSDDRAVREVMRPRLDMLGFSLDASWDEIIAGIAEHGYSRWPIYEESIDHIVGLLYRRDLLSQLISGKDLPPLESLLRPPLFVPESKLLSDLITEMRAAHCHMAIVLDEYGSTEGLVTLEDLLEEVFGEIQDETDPVDHEVLRLLPQGALAEGGLPLAEIEDLFDLPEDLPLEEYDTVAGFILGELGRLPEENEVLSFPAYGLEIIVRQLDGYRIRTVEIRERE